MRWETGAAIFVAGLLSWCFAKFVAWSRANISLHLPDGRLKRLLLWTTDKRDPLGNGGRHR